MQIDFHHAVTYVVARLAGFGHRDAEVIAYCAQYVDDANNTGEVIFENGAMYSRICSAHHVLDYRNFDELASRRVWVAFHFLPANGGKTAGENPDGTFIDKLVCGPESPVAEDMVRCCIEKQGELFGLHRLGITLHVYADSWAHRGFAGVSHQINDVRKLDDQDRPDPGFLGELKDFFGDRFDAAANRFVSNSYPLGHGAALSCPDVPYLRWQYRNGRGETVIRNNPDDFLQAADSMCRVMQRFRVGDADAKAPGLSGEMKEKIGGFLAGFQEKEKKDRHKRWLDEIANGAFGFPPVKLTYKAKGKGSWKHEALDTRRIYDRKQERFKYHPSFLGCDWKLFHDALQAHRFDVVNVILPRYGICVA